MSKYSILSFSIVLFINLINISLSKNAYDSLLEWGKNNSLEISPKLSMQYSSENIRDYFSSSKISKGESLLKIPRSIMLNLENSFKLFKTKKFYELYQIYKEQKPNTKLDFIPLSDTIQQSFLAYIMYNVNQKLKHFQKGKFYKHFHYFFDTFETTMDSFPLFYNRRQLQLLQATLTHDEIVSLVNYINEEMDIFKTKLDQKEISVVEDFYRYRTFTISKGIKIKDEINLVPFIDLFDTDPIDYNIEYKILENEKAIEVFATKEIKPGEKLVIKAPYLMNRLSFIFYGKTYPKMKDYAESYKVPAISEVLMRRKAVDVEEYDTDYKVDILDDKYFVEIIPMYKDFAKKAKEEGSDLSAFNLLYTNIDIFRQNMNEMTTSHMHAELYQTKDIENVKLLIESEKKILDKALARIKEEIEKIKKVNKEKEHMDKKVGGDL